MEQNNMKQAIENDGYFSFYFDQISTEVEEDEFEIGVKPTRKIFNSSLEKQQFIEEYTKKKKTELCKNFMLKGSCKFGSECSYAHGQSELLPKSHLHQNYKTKPCKNFLNNGWCNYGSRCQYIHPDNSLNKNKLKTTNSNNKQVSNLQKDSNKNSSQLQIKQKGYPSLQINMLYSELLEKLNYSSQMSLQNLPRLSFFKRLGKSKICFLSDDSDR
ncbi:unnamed protein product [Paramecium primaurelia]|uniref:C3H1-type domain-containing protein n=1 Tax=Paramecium primaurelia TaxID=5886 RepID=A0A8S1KEP2_PARPR|nr:unnamed protein product [Paramecium primaurelia]